MHSQAIKAKAVELGFDLCGIATVRNYEELGFLDAWLARGYAGEMQYMAKSAERRRDVRAVMPSAQSVISLATVYNTDRPYSTTETDSSRAHIARYAWGEDYHDILGRRMEALAAWIREQAPQAELRAYVDTGPVQERVYAAHAGIGWIAKNTCVINERLGSWLFLSEILCSLALEPDDVVTDRCGTCTACLDACPTGALVEAGVLDSTKCLSYLTIELKGPIPENLRPAVGTHVYGCDICQDVCPWNRRAAVSGDPAWQPLEVFDGRTLAELWRTPDAELRRGLKTSAMSRAGVKRLRRNIAVAAGATEDPDAIAALEDIHEPSCEEPLVTDAIDWARATASTTPEAQS